jgi:hypothetical protein
VDLEIAMLREPGRSDDRANYSMVLLRPQMVEVALFLLAGASSHLVHIEREM